MNKPVQGHTRNVAIISPVGLLERCHTRYHLVLPQYYTHDAEYATFYRNRRAANDFIILDNGAAELKVPITTEDLLQVAAELRPNLISAPDTIYDMQTTLSATLDFCRKYAASLRVRGIDILGIPQGASKEQWEACYHVFNNEPAIKWLGISMFYTPKYDRRYNALEAIAPTVTKPCHLLGLWSDPFELLREREFPFVRSVDTAKPIEWALEGLTLRGWMEHKHLDDDWYFALTEEEVSSKLDLIDQNVSQFTQLFCEGIECQ